MSDLQELLERVEKATGPDREIDVALHVNVLGKVIEDDRDLFYTPSYTASIDAALALVATKLPGVEWGRRARNDNEDSPTMIELAWPVVVDDEDEWEFSDADDTGSTPLAIICALLRALIAKGDTNHANG